jgi:hypothetical protein
MIMHILLPGKDFRSQEKIKKAAFLAVLDGSEVKC